MMAAPMANGAAPQMNSALLYPALHLFPLNDTFVPKQILLAPPGERIKIGRQTNAKTVPSSVNGYFDSKVLSRMHAEVWFEDNKVYVKDVKSSNGTFINGDRLSPEGVESDVFELHSDDVVEFGIDIVSDDNKTIIHHKVAAKIHLVFTAEDALMMNKNMPAYYRSVHDAQLSRRPSKPGQAAFSFDHVLSRLQSELQKSRETSDQLNTINTLMSDVQDTMSGSGPLPVYAVGGRIPPVMPPPGPRNDPHAQTIASLQQQLVETQQSLNMHVDKVRSLESLLAGHDSIKVEVEALRAQMDEAKRDMDDLLRASRTAALPSQHLTNGSRADHDRPDDDLDGDDDDASDTASVISLATVRARSPARRHRSASPPRSFDAVAASHGDDTALAAKVELLAAELAEATALGQSLRSQHAEASETTRTLEQRIQSLELRVQEAEHSAEGRWDGWRRAFEASWQRDRDEWTAEREKLRLAVAEWEERRRRADSSSSEDDDGSSTDAHVGSLSPHPPSTDVRSAAPSPSFAGAYPRSPADANDVAANGSSSRRVRRRRRRSTAGPSKTAASAADAGAADSSRGDRVERHSPAADATSGWTTALDGSDDQPRSPSMSGSTTRAASRDEHDRGDKQQRRHATRDPHQREAPTDAARAALPVASVLGAVVLGMAIWTVVRKET